MKAQLIKSLFLLGLIFFAFSCGEDEIMDSQEENNASHSQFTIHAGEILGFSGDRYIMATSPLTGDVLYWDVMTSFKDSISFDAGDLETVDLTYASEYSTGFSIVTYRDVKTDFKFSRFRYSCFEDQFSVDNLTGKSVDILFPGTKEIVEFINPAYDHSELQETSNATIDQENKIIYDLDNDLTVVNAKLRSTSLGLQFVFRFLGEQEYKSIIIKREDWVKVDDDNYKRELEIGDLLPCNVHEINVGIDETWIVDSEIHTPNGDRVAIAQWSHYSQNQMGDKIRLFLQDDLEVDQLLLKVKRNNSKSGFEFQNYFDDVPISISLKEYVNDVSDLTPYAFNYSTAEDFDLVKTSYEFLIDNHISSWTIYQPSSSTSDYILPVIESDFLDETNLIKSALTNPIEFRIQFYSLETPVDELYYETGIDRQLPCLSFNSSYESYEF